MFWENFLLPDCLQVVIVWKWMKFSFTIDHQNKSWVAGQSNRVRWPKMDCPKFWISKNVQFRHMCGAFRFWSNFGWPKIWANPCWSPHSIALACYPWLILVINCDNEVCSCSNNTVSKAFWQKKVLPEQKISCCGVIYWIWINYKTAVFLKTRIPQGIFQLYGRAFDKLYFAPRRKTEIWFRSCEIRMSNFCYDLSNKRYITH